MANSVGERAKEDAEAAKARSIDRNLSAEVQGAGVEMNVHTGKPAMVREICRKRRLRKMQEFAAEHTEKDGDLAFGYRQPEKKADKDKRACFARVDSIELVGIEPTKEILYDDEEYEKFQQRLEALARQIPEFFDFHEKSVFDALEGTPEDVSPEFLGIFRAPHRDLKIDHEWVRALWRDADDG